MNKELYERVKKIAAERGYSSAREFVEHVLEKELAQEQDCQSDAEIARKLQGLGYLD